tara:strand:- start:3983 stop:4720 length:738 start_codon:yes stop_codon:yes gene_type:complete
MKKKSNLLLIAIVFATLVSCKKEVAPQNQKNIDGLWIVKILKLDGKDFTINEKWFRFEADSTQTSGNGWQQHTTGSWSYQKESNRITIKNDNNFNDFLEYKNPFNVTFDKNSMTLQGTDRGKDVTIVLERATKLPTTEANKLLGLWKFDSIFVDDKEVSDSLNPTKKGMIYLGFENNYTLYNYPEGEKYGIFKTHSMRNQIDLINSSRTPEYQYYKFRLENDNLTLKSTNSNKEIKLTRIHQFSQ